MSDPATWDEFERLELAVGVVTEVEDFPEARDPAFKLTMTSARAERTARARS